MLNEFIRPEFRYKRVSECFIVSSFKYACLSERVTGPRASRAFMCRGREIDNAFNFSSKEDADKWLQQFQAILAELNPGARVVSLSSVSFSYLFVFQ